MLREPANAFVLVPTQIARDAMPLGDDEEMVPTRAASFRVRFREHAAVAAQNPASGFPHAGHPTASGLSGQQTSGIAQLPHDPPQQAPHHEPVGAAADDGRTVDAAQDTGVRSVRLRAQAVAVEDEDQCVVGETMAPAEDKPPPMLSFDHPETGHGLARAAGKTGSALRGIAAQNPRQRTAREALIYSGRPQWPGGACGAKIPT